jgi:hypothetical protein
VVEDLPLWGGVSTRFKENVMRASGIILSLACAAIFLAPTVASAQATRTWISGVGDDVNPCSRTAPCKTFPGAIAKTAAGGEIDTLDPGGFGAVTVTKSITLADEGVGEGGILVAGTNGVTVNLSTCPNGSDANCTVILRGLQIDGGPTNSNSLAGVKFLAGHALIIENCAIRNFTGGSPNGYGVFWNAPPLGTQQNLLIDHSTIVTNGQSSVAGGGVFIQPSSGTPNLNVSITNSRISNNQGLGVRADGTLGTGGSVYVTLANDEVSGNGAGAVAGVSGTAGGSTSVLMNVSHSTITGNNVGLNGNGNFVTVHIGQSVLTNNATGVKVTNSAIVNSYGGNLIADNPIPGPVLAIIGPF